MDYILIIIKYLIKSAYLNYSLIHFFNHLVVNQLDKFN